MYLFIGTSLLLLLSSCLLDPNKQPEPRKPIITFSGSATIIPEGQTDINRSIKIPNPQIAVIWQYFGGYTKQFHYKANSLVNAVAPYNFNADFFDYPPKELMETKDPVIGSFWMYSDYNQNNQLDDFYHPEYSSAINILTEKNQQYLKELDDFLTQVEKQNLAQRTLEVFYLDVHGNLSIETPQGEVFLFNLQDLNLKESEFRGKFGEKIFEERMKILQNRNKWEEFFVLRHGSVKLNRVTTTTITSTQKVRYELTYMRRLYPKNQTLLEFEKKSFAVSNSGAKLLESYDSTEALANTNKWKDYGYKRKLDKDWVVGRSRWYYVLYIPNQLEKDQITAAERWSPYQTENPHNLKIGFNLFNCNYELKCEIFQNFNDITIDFGEKDSLYVQPRNFKHLPLGKDSIPERNDFPSREYTGIYEFAPFSYWYVWTEGKEIWFHFPKKETFSLKYAERDFFASNLTQSQIRFYTPSDSLLTKMILFQNKFKAAALSYKGNWPNDVLELKAKISQRKWTPILDSSIVNPGNYCQILDSKKCIEIKKSTGLQVAGYKDTEFFLSREENSQFLGHPSLGELFEYESTDSSKILHIHHIDGGIQDYERKN